MSISMSSPPSSADATLTAFLQTAPGSVADTWYAYKPLPLCTVPLEAATESRGELPDRLSVYGWRYLVRSGELMGVADVHEDGDHWLVMRFATGEPASALARASCAAEATSHPEGEYEAMILDWRELGINALYLRGRAIDDLVFDVWTGMPSPQTAREFWAGATMNAALLKSSRAEQQSRD
ncbi:MAG TPA: hypothetical protein VGC56_07285 [Allosphingosinicella sp.]|jgi:hypothetical protein